MIDYEKFWGEIIRETQEHIKQDDEMTVSDFSNLTKLSWTAAYRKLERLVKEGKLTKRSKKGAYAYYKPA